MATGMTIASPAVRRSWTPVVGRDCLRPANPAESSIEHSGAARFGCHAGLRDLVGTRLCSECSSDSRADGPGDRFISQRGDLSDPAEPGRSCRPAPPARRVGPTSREATTSRWSRGSCCEGDAATVKRPSRRGTPWSSWLWGALGRDWRRASAALGAAGLPGAVRRLLALSVIDVETLLLPKEIV